MWFKSIPLVAASAASLVCAIPFPEDDFHSPPVQFRPKFRYWLPDASVAADVVTQDIRDAEAVGAGGLEILPFYLYGMGEESFRRNQQQSPDFVVPDLPDWSRYGFGTPAFVSLFKSSLQSAKDAGILLDYALGPNQGQGVPAKVGTPGLAVELLMGNTTISPLGSFSAPVPMGRQPSETILSGLGFMHPLEQFGTPDLTAVIAYQVLNQSASNSTTGSKVIYLNQSSFVDLMPLVKDGWSLQWTPPDTTKTWKILSFWESYTNQRSCDGGPNATEFIGNGSWTVDHFSQTGAAKVTDFWDERILSDTETASLLRAVGKYAWEDSMEILASLYWTPGLLDRFKRKHGYSLQPYLPLFFDKSNTWGGYLPVYDEVYKFFEEKGLSSSVHQLDYRSALNDGYQDYLAHFQEWAHSIGTEYSAQPAYNLPLQMLSDIPFVDAPEGESLGFSRLVDAYRQFAGPAHLANRSIISTELGAVRVPPYSLRLPDLLQQIKRSFAGGFTMNVLHGFPASTPYPNTTWPGYTTFFYEFTEMWNQIQPAWQHLRDALDYVARNQWVLQQGDPQIDLAFYLYAGPWSPKTQYTSTNLRDLGYTYDYLGPDGLVSPEAFVKDRALGIPKYKSLVVVNQSVITVGAVQSMVQMASSGLPIFFIGAVPNQSYPVDAANHTSLEVTMKHLLATENVYHADSVDEIPTLLSEHGITPRTSLNCTSNPVYSMTRTLKDVDYVYFFNDQQTPTTCTATIMSLGSRPFVYDAWTGSQTPLGRYHSTNTSLILPLELKSNQTLILALHKSLLVGGCSVSEASEALHSMTLLGEKYLATVTGPTVLKTSIGKTLRLDPSLPNPVKLSRWNLIIEDWHSAPDRFAVRTEISTHKYNNISLTHWKQLDSSLSVVSGMGHYSTSFTVPVPASSNSSLVGIVRLPLIQHTARIYLDGKQLPPFDPVDPVITLGTLQAGASHELRIDVTTTLFNRIKAEANKTMVVGQVAGKRQPLYNSRPFEEYGLVGEVELAWGEQVSVQC